MNNDYIKATVLSGIDRAAALQGIALEPLYDVLYSAPLAAPRNPMRQPDTLLGYAGLCRFLQATTGKCGDDFILKWFEQAEHGFSFYDEAALHTGFFKNCHDWLAFVGTFLSLRTNGPQLALVDEGHDAFPLFRFSDNSLFLPCRQFVELTFLLTLQLLRQFCGPGVLPLAQVRFQHDRPPHAAAVEQAFGCRIVWGSTHCELVFNRPLAEVGPSMTIADPATLMDQYLLRHERNSGRQTLSFHGRLEATIAVLLGSDRCNVESVAQFHRVNVKAMQRRLLNEGTSFSNILETLRLRLASQYLIETNMPIAEVSRLLGYSAPSGFTIAFSRMARATPLRFRKMRRPRAANPL